jgi:hypothetical protein
VSPDNALLRCIVCRMCFKGLCRLVGGKRKNYKGWRKSCYDRRASKARQVRRQQHRAEWSKKRGWYKFGTRKCMIDETDPIFGRAVPLFKEKYGDDLEKVFKSEKLFDGVQSVVAFAEFFGSKSFAGMHFPDDQSWDIVLFDLNLHKKGMLGPKEFIDTSGT